MIALLMIFSVLVFLNLTVYGVNITKYKALLPSLKTEKLGKNWEISGENGEMVSPFFKFFHIFSPFGEFTGILREEKKWETISPH